MIPQIKELLMMSFLMVSSLCCETVLLATSHCCFTNLLFLFLFSDGLRVKNIKDAVKSVEMSKNAQFRAIQPSHSILSYVEENVIYMTISLMVSYVIFSLDG